MNYTVSLSEDQVEILKSIFSQIAPTQYVNLPTLPARTLTKEEEAIKRMRERRAAKASRKNK
jgi:hypothetical protein